MFDGSSEQFHQFIASSTISSSLPSFPLHGSPSCDPYAPPPPPPPPPLHHQPERRKEDPWSNDELLSLLKLRSSMEIWFPDFTWEHVSRKLGEIGFKRSAEQCKEKFEEESRNYNSSTRILSDLDHLCNNQPTMEKKPCSEEEEKKKKCEELDEEMEAASKKNKKRKRRDEKFERFKGFCEGVVKKMMASQEHLHNNLIQDVIRRDQEKMARDEAWKAQELERIRTLMESRSKEQKSAADRQAVIVNFLNHFTSNTIQEQEQEQEQEHLTNKLGTSNATSNSSSSNKQSTRQNPPPPSSPSSTNPPPPPCSSGDDVGKRWPRDEVLALINLRCRMSGGGEQEAAASKEKGPLWERISQGMMEMGYKRSAKRCKEKWENINKYFRKTKDSTKKRSINSRTCPYFHHLSSLYGDGTIVAPAAVVDLGGGGEGDGGGAAIDVDVNGVFL